MKRNFQQKLFKGITKFAIVVYASNFIGCSKEHVRSNHYSHNNEMTIIEESKRHGHDFFDVFDKWIETPLKMEKGTYSLVELFDHIAKNQDVFPTIEIQDNSVFQVEIPTDGYYKRIALMKMVTEQTKGHFWLNDEGRIVFGHHDIGTDDKPSSPE